MPNPVKTHVISPIAELKKRLSELKKEGSSIGFVPTMGALHNGHLALVERCKSENSICLVSIFVNPTQFNDPNDFKNYPRTLEEDLKKLENSACDLIFTPNIIEIYEAAQVQEFDLGSMEKTMEGKHRPGHFKGVADIVSRFINLIHPDKLYLGQKDFQQVAILKDVIRQMGSKTQVVECATVREENGLAMSSRNELLSSEQRQNAGIIYKVLCGIKVDLASKSIETLIKEGMEKINNTKEFTCEYLELVDADSLQRINTTESTANVQACIAVKVGRVRLIDNLKIK